MLCCLDVQLQGFSTCLGIGVTTNNPGTGPLPQRWSDIDASNKYWYVLIRSHECIAYHKEQERVLQWVLDDSEGNTLGCCVLERGELHLYHNGRDVGVVWEGLSTDQPLWGFVCIGGMKVETNFISAKGEAVWCGVVLCVRVFCLDL